MGWFLKTLHLPPIGTETVPHIDIASAALAFLALAFSIYTFFHQRKVRMLSVIAQRDSGLIRWLESVIDTLVDIEFMLRNWTPAASTNDYLRQRDDHLARLAAIIDKGRLYFPNFTRDVIGSGTPPAATSIKLPLLDDLVEIYDLTKKVEFGDADVVKMTKEDVMLKKLDFIRVAQKQVEFRRTPGIIE
jgi:hypothetical protein